MEFHVITLFPEMFESPFRGGMVGRAIEQRIITVKPHALRPFGLGNYKQVDDQPYGGGSGMVMRPEPIAAAIDAVKAKHPELVAHPDDAARRAARQHKVRELAGRKPGLLLIAGRYEGVDERVRAMVDQEISIGDYVLAGGELPAMVVIEAVTRMLPGVLGNSASLMKNRSARKCSNIRNTPGPRSFAARPSRRSCSAATMRKSARWRREQALERTARRRPDLLGDQGRRCSSFIALIHHPVVDRNGRIVASAITSLDLHDMARSAHTYGVTRDYMVHPVPELREFAAERARPLDGSYGRQFDGCRREALETGRGSRATLMRRSLDATRCAGSRRCSCIRRRAPRAG